MSSHHIVREDQEPALLILDTAAASCGVVEQLLEWSPTVIVCEAVIEQVLSWGIKIDVAIISSKHKPDNELLNQTPIQIIQSENNFLLDGLNFALSKKYKALNMLVSHKVDLDRLSEVPANIDLVAFHDHLRWSLIRRGKFEKWVLKETQVFIYPNLNVLPTGLTEKLKAIEPGLVKIESDTPFWVGESTLEEN